MKYPILLAIVVVIAGAAGAPPCRAADEPGRFSLGFGSLNLGDATPRERQTGVVTARYRLLSFGSFQPYLGTGVGYSLPPDDTPPAVDRLRTGVAGQAGFSYLLGEKTTFTLDYKLLDLGPDAQRGRTPGLPQSIGVGFQIHF